MTRRLIVFLICALMTNGIAAQDSVTVKFQNQYEAPVDNITVINGGRTVTYRTNNLGFATIHINPSDTVTIMNGGYEKYTAPGASLQQQSLVQLKKKFSWKDLINPMFYIIYGGLWLLLFIVYAETGLFAGFFLPGDSLLFVAGIYSSNLSHEFLKMLGLGQMRYEWIDLLILITLVSIAGILGNMTGYWFGKKIGPAMYSWKDRFLYKKKYLYEAHDFYEKYGGGAVIFARFMPIVRTFAPIVAGIVQMDGKKFTFFNIVGCIAWVISMILAGHFLQIWVKRQFGFELKDHLEMIVIIIVLVTTAPVLWKLIFGKRKPTAPVS